MDRQPVDAFGGLHDGLGDGRVRVDDAPQLFGRRFEVEGDDGLVNDLGRVRADDVDAQQLVVLRLADDLDEALLLAEDARLARGREGELRRLHVVAQLLRLRLGQTDGRDLRVAVGARGHVAQVDRVRLLAGDLLDGEDALLRREVREPRRRDHVADGEDPGLARAAELVHLDRPALDLDLRPFEPEPFQVRHAPDGDQKHLRFETDVAALRVLARDADARVRSLDLFELRARQALQAALAERLLKRLGNLLVFERHDARQQLDERRLRAEARVDGGELGADRAGAHDDERLRHLFEFEDVVGVDYTLAVGLEARDGADDRARRDDDVLRVDVLRLAVLARDRDLARQRQLARALEDGDGVLLHQELDALRVLRHDLRLALLHVLEGEPHLGDLHAEVLEVFVRLLVVVRRHQELLGRDAAAQRTRPAEPLVLLDERHLQPQLRPAYRGHVPARPRPDHRHVELFRRQIGSPRTAVNRN